MQYDPFGAKKRPHHLRNELECYRGDCSRKATKAKNIAKDDLKIAVQVPSEWLENVKKKRKRGVIKIKAGYARGLEWYFMVRRMDLNVLFAKGRKEKPRKPKKKKGGFL